MDALKLLLLPLSAGLAGSFLFEQLLNPRPLLPWRRTPATRLLHIGTWLLLFDVDLLLFQRPWFAVATLQAFQLLLVLVHYAKYYNLRESFIFQDFEYFTDAIKHPRLYLPFFGVGRTIAAIVGFIAAFGIGIMLEPPLALTLARPALIIVLAALLISSLALLKIGLYGCPGISCDPDADLRKLGQAAFFWAYWHAENKTAINPTQTPFKDALSSVGTATLPHVVAVQCESFFDPRPLSDNIKSSVLTHFDLTKSEACRHGRLNVPAWGANTVRTECAFLTGLSPRQLGIHRFNPYRLLANQRIPNLASHLKRMGYQTLCVHPYPASFYLRDKVFPLLGFDQFIDIRSFNAGQKCGQFIGDLATAEKVNELLQNNDKTPLFIFVITMENHGPLHLEQPDLADEERFYHQTPPPECEDLSVYLRHLNNADLMIKYLKNYLHSQTGVQEQGREGVLCWYGDHVPIMPKVYGQFGEPNGQTEYFIWRTNPFAAKQEAGKQQTIFAHDLASLMLNIIRIPTQTP
jgi:hypothetical protein